MCQLCSSDPKEREHAQNALISFAAQLDTMSGLMHQIVSCNLKPHTAELRCETETLTRSLIRTLVGEWL